MLNWKCFMDIISFHIFLCISYLEKNGFIKSHCVTQIKTDIHTDYAVFMKRTYFNYFFYTVISLQQSLFCCTFFSQVLFCLEGAGVLFAVCNSFACSVLFFHSLFLVCSMREFCLQCTHIFFLQFTLYLQCAGVVFLDVFFIFVRNYFICNVFSLLRYQCTPNSIIFQKNCFWNLSQNMIAQKHTGF